MNTAWDSIDPAIINKWSISNDLDGTDNDVLWDEQHDKSDMDSDKEGDKMYDDTRTNTSILQQMFNKESDTINLFGFE